MNGLEKIYALYFLILNKTHRCSCQTSVDDCSLGSAHRALPSECERCQGEHQTPHPGQYPALLKQRAQLPTCDMAPKQIEWKKKKSQKHFLQFDLVLLWISSSRAFTFPRCLIKWMDFALDSHSLLFPPSIPTPDQFMQRKAK